MCNGYSSHRYKVRFIRREGTHPKKKDERGQQHLSRSFIPPSHFPTRSRSFSVPPPPPLSSPRSNSISSRFSFLFPLSLFSFSTVAINVSTFQRHGEMKSLLCFRPDARCFQIYYCYYCATGEKPCTRRVDQKFSSTSHAGDKTNAARQSVLLPPCVA